MKMFTKTCVWTLVALFGVAQSADEGYCEKSDGGVNCFADDDFKLSRMQFEKVGEVRTVQVDQGRDLHVRTLNIKPPVFEVEQFLSAEECDHFIKVAEEQGMVQSHTERQSSQSGVQLMDINGDKQLDMKEMKLTLENSYDVYLEDEDLLTMYTTLGLDTNHDNKISQSEMSSFRQRDLTQYLKDILSKHPEKHSRYSRQAWLFPDQSTDEVFQMVQQRVSTVVGLPLSLIRLSDFQVVNYGVDGHYNAHLDSSHIRPDIPCCDRGKLKNCRICRFMTVLFYLNDVEEGGETAFPFANLDNINHTAAHLDRVHHLFKHCETAPLRVSAQRGKAVIWYNHRVRDSDSWMGDLDEHTLHGGCPVKQGHKWIANFWIKTTDNKQADMDRIKKMSESIDQ